VFEDVNGVNYVLPMESIQGMQTKTDEDGKPLSTFIVKVHDGGEKLIEVDKATFENLADYYSQEYNQYWERKTEELAIALAEDCDGDNIDDELREKLDELLRQKQSQQPYTSIPWADNTYTYGHMHQYTPTIQSSGSSSSASTTISNSTTSSSAEAARRGAVGSSNTKVNQQYLKNYMEAFKKAKGGPDD
jgi:hypothetical protein